MFIVTMETVLPPLTTEDCQEDRGTGDLSDNSA
jgi:hypothetical protein